MTTTKAQQRALLHLMRDPSAPTGTVLLPSGALMVRLADTSARVIERDGRVQA